MKEFDAKIDNEVVRCRREDRRGKVEVKINGEEFDDEEIGEEERVMLIRSEEVDNELVEDDSE